VRLARGQVAIIGGAIVLALLAVLFPPWRARVIRSTTRYAAVAGVAPAILIDTVAWSLSFEPLFVPPRAPILAAEQRRLAERAASGDTAARAQLRRVMEPFERRYNAPEVIRTSGELWRDSVLAVARVPAVSSYDASFFIDDWRLATRLMVIAAVAGLLEYRRRRRSWVTRITS
jgi:hypothetical protein